MFYMFSNYFPMRLRLIHCVNNICVKTRTGITNKILNSDAKLLKFISLQN